MSGRLVALEGIDGAGKDTIAPLLAAELRRRGVRAEALTCRDVPRGDQPVAAHARALHDLIWGGGKTPRLPAQALPESYWPPLVGAWFAMLGRSVLAPALARSSIVICAGWGYKLRARMALSDVLEDRWIAGCMATVPPVDRMLLLDVDPATALSRKGTVTQHERGGVRFSGRSAHEQFLLCQKEMQGTLREFARSDGWYVVDADTDDPESVARKCLNGLFDLLEPAERPRSTQLIPEIANER